MAVPGLQADETVLVRAVAADPRSDWRHGYAAGSLFITDRRLLVRPWTFPGDDHRLPWELSLEVIDRVSSAPVPVWLFGLVRIWLHGIRLVTADGQGRTIVVGRARAAACIATLEGLLMSRRRSSERTRAPSSS